MKLKPRPEYIFVIENNIGGVAYLNKNIINNATLRNDAIVKLIIIQNIESKQPQFPENILADEIIHFNYSTKENKYSVLKKLHVLFGTLPGIIVCNDGLEMEAIYLYGTNKTVFQYIHDFYNIRLAVKYGAIVDVFITHTKLFRDVLLSAAPSTQQSIQLNHGVNIPPFQENKNRSQYLRIVFTGRLVKSKGVDDLFAINALLKKQNITVEWTIIGRGELHDFLLEQWADTTNVKFASPDTNVEVLELMLQNDIFILPTHFEGSPVTVLEALACALVPIVSDLPGGINEIIGEDIGRKIPIGDVISFAETIAFFHANREILQQMSLRCRKTAEQHFNIINTSNNYFSLFAEYEKFKKKNVSLPAIHVGFRLDNKWMPNFLVRFMRSAKKKNK